MLYLGLILSVLYLMKRTFIGTVKLLICGAFVYQSQHANRHGFLFIDYNVADSIQMKYDSIHIFKQRAGDMFPVAQQLSQRSFEFD